YSSSSESGSAARTAGGVPFEVATHPRLAFERAARRRLFGDGAFAAREIAAVHRRDATSAEGRDARGPAAQQALDSIGGVLFHRDKWFGATPPRSSPRSRRAARRRRLRRDRARRRSLGGRRNKDRARHGRPPRAPTP